MNKKPMLGIITAVCLFIGVSAFAESNAVIYADKAELVVAKALLDEVLEDKPFAGETVTRGEFVDVMTRIFKVSSEAVKSAVYLDVGEDHVYAGGIKKALDEGWICGGGNFRPDDNILLSEALKITISAAGYSEIAQHSGGFPSGYYVMADEIDLLDGIRQREDKLLDKEQATVLLYNLLNAKYKNREYIYNIGSTQFYDNGNEKTVLETFYNIKKSEGIINSTSYNSFEYDTPVNINTKNITVDGVRYIYEDVKPDLLGKYAVVFYYADNDEAVVVNTGFKNETVKAELRDIEFKNENLIEYVTQNDKVKKLELSGGILTYNGRTVNELNAECFKGDGYAEFIDNNDDGKYEIVHVTAYTYIVADSIDRLNRKIGDANSNEYSLNLKECSDELLEIYDENNEELSLYNVVSGDVFEIKAPKDGSFIHMRRLNSYVSGAIEKKDEEYLTINGNEYRYTGYFSDNYLEKISMGISGAYYIGYDNMLVMCESNNVDFQYGFILKSYFSDDDSMYFIRLFTEEGVKKDFAIREKIVADGNLVSDSELSSACSQLGDADRLVKYSVNAKGEITKIDFPSVYDYSKIESQRNEVNNNLIYYSGYDANLTYRGNAKTFTSKVALAESKCFMIPEDLDESLKYFKSGPVFAVLKHNVSYKTFVYDINEEGSAGMVVVRGIDDNISAENSYIVERVYHGLDDEGAPAMHIVCFGNNSYQTYYMSYDMSAGKDSGDVLEPGDIIRIKTDAENYIYKIQVDFDYGAFDKTSTLPAANYERTESSKSYWMGLAYSLSSTGFVQIASEKNDFGEYDFSQYKLKPMSVKNNIVRFDCKTKRVRPITFEEIKTYRAFGEDCEFIVLCSDYDVSKMAVVYDNHQER